MRSFQITPEQAELALRALKMITTADGHLDDWELATLLAAREALRVTTGLDALLPVEPREIASAVAAPEARERLVQAMITVSLVDGSPAPNEIAMIERFARELEISEPRLHNLRQLADGRTRMVWFNLARKSFARREFIEALQQEGLRGVWKIVGPMLGMAQDPALARSFRDLEQLPPGTLGHSYFHFISQRGFQFPGERGGIPERGVWHDMTHILGGYDTDAEGEVKINAFQAGFRDDDPFFWMFTNQLHFHLGVKMSPYAPVERWLFEPTVIIRNLRRGMAVNTDLSERWSWREVLAEPVEGLQRRYNILPEAHFA